MQKFPLQLSSESGFSVFMRNWSRAALILASIWILAGIVIFSLRSTKPTAQSIDHYILTNQIENLPPPQRSKIINRVASQLNRLDFNQRQELRKQKTDRLFFNKLTQEERREFLEATLPEGFRQFMKALNAMDRKERQKIVSRALRDLEKDRVEVVVEDEDAKKLIEEGLGAFYEEASADVKLEFAPVIERMQRVTQGLR
jgi:flagellar motor protein MotB